MTAMTIRTNTPAGAPTRPTTARRRTERMVMLRSAMPGVQLVTLRHSVPLRLGALTTEDLTSGTRTNATPKVERERVLETTAGKGGDAR